MSNAMGIKAIVSLESTSPYSQSRMHDEEKKAKESHADFERRIWREKSHYDDRGELFIPRMSFKFCIADAAAYVGEKVPEKGQRTWTSYFTSGILVENDLDLGVHKDKVQGITIPAHAGGSRKGVGSGKRVHRTFPIIHRWAGELVVLVMDATIKKEIFTRVMQHAGMFIGIGRFRPQNGGINGRFKVNSVRWESLVQ